MSSSCCWPAAPTAHAEISRARPRSISRPTPTCATSFRPVKAPLELQSGDIGRQRPNNGIRYRLHEVGHARIVGARAGAKIGHGLGQVVVVLAGEPRLPAVALETFLMAAVADNRGVGALSPRRDVTGCRRLCQIGPWFL